MESEDCWFIFLCSIVMVFLIFSLILGFYENPKISDFVDSLLVGILVIITGYYAFWVKKQVKLLQKQHERAIRREFSIKLLPKLREQLKQNIEFLQEECFMHCQAEPITAQVNRLERRMLEKFSESESEFIRNDFYESNPEIEKEIREYRLRVVEFIGDYTEFMSELFADAKKGDLLKRISHNSDLHENNVVFPWIVKKLLMQKYEFMSQDKIQIFLDHIWNPYRDELEEFIIPFYNKGKEIGSDRLKLLKLSKKLLNKLV